MGRRLKGWITQRGDAWYFGLTHQGKSHEERIEPDPGQIIDRETADRVREAMIDRYLRGLWTPGDKAARITKPKRDQTVYEYALEWIDKQSYETVIKDRRVIKRRLGNAPIGRILTRNLSAGDVLDYLHWLGKQPCRRGGTLSPRSVREGFDVLKRCLNDAVIVGILPANPCDPVTSKQPQIKDKDPLERDGWPFSHEEIHALCSSSKLTLPNRVFNSIRFFAGPRFSEIACLRWKDLDRNMVPLWRMTIARALKTSTGKEGRTKTGAVKMIPVHPQLEKILSYWHEQWHRYMGRNPTNEDLVLPVLHGKTRGNTRNCTVANRQFKADCVTLGIRPRRQHATRHTYCTRVQDDGADGPSIQWTTHAPKRSGNDPYTRTPWHRVCQEIIKYRATIDIPELTPNNPDDNILPLKTLDEKRMHSGIEPPADAIHKTTNDSDYELIASSGNVTSRLVPSDSPKCFGLFTGEVMMHDWIERELLKDMENPPEAADILSLDDLARMPREQWPTWIDHAEIDQMIAERESVT